MNRRRLTLLTLVLLLCTLISSQLHAEDGIPDNCETAAADRLSLFARYEPQNRRLVLVDWNTGADVQTIASDLATTSDLRWSPDCHYLAGAVAAATGWDTVVFDVTTSTTIGKVVDAQGKPHPITWGPSPYLMVETRAGGILWNVATNTQITVTTGFNKTTYRNFNRLRWDAASNQVIADLAVGGREVYDLTTGQRIPEAANVLDTSPAEAFVTGSIVIGGKPYSCRARYNSLNDIAVSFNSSQQRLFIQLARPYRTGDVLQIIEEGLNTSRFRFAGWSPSCRYFAGRVGTSGLNSDTVVWDIVENRRVGMFEDARRIGHPLTWSQNADSIFIQTRHGAYLWYVPTDTRTLITSEVETAITGPLYIKNVENYRWESGKLYVQPLGAAADANWLIFDEKTGQQVGEGLPPQYVPYQRPSPDQTLVPMSAIEGTSGYTTYDYDTTSRYFDECDGRIVFYDTSNRTLLIKDARTGDFIQTVSSDLNQTIPFWSPNCEWVYGLVDAISNEQLGYDSRPLDDLSPGSRTNRVVLWNVAQGNTEPQFALENPFKRRTYAAVTWSPSGDRAIAYTTNGSYLLNLLTGEQSLLTFSQGPGALFSPRATAIYWDYSRGQVLINGTGYDGFVYAFDMGTGVERYRFAGGGVDYRGNDFIVQDNKTLFIIGRFSTVSIWDLDTLANSQVSLGNYQNIAFSGNRIALSQDGRYLVMGYENLRVWDLTNLVEEVRDRGPIASYPVGEWGTVTSVRFVDNVTVEITSSDGGTRQMNVETGDVITPS